ncbi:MAG TPA: hypothetical protein VMV27_08670 [Candidatus Binataceae bacterium]|nr:hypothetical protein [Candidatus Binataceae bacterium]
MSITERFTSRRGAIQLGFTDALVAAIMLGILLFAAYLQFPAYHPAPSTAPGAATASAPR